MANRLVGKVAVVTGSGRGIGRAIAMAIAREGAKVVVNDLGCDIDGAGVSSIVADEVVAEIRKQGGIVVANYDSVATHEGADSIIKTAVDNFGKIDILVNNAGNDRRQMLWDMTDEEWDTVVKTHLYGNFYCTRTAVIHMRGSISEGKQRNGSIINITSHAGIKGNPKCPSYSAAKMGVVGFTYSCALALAGYAINCNAVAPHAYSRFADNVSDDDMRQLAVARGVAEADILPIDEVKKKFLGPPEAIAPLVCWLASNEAGNISGQVFLARLGRVGMFCPMDESKLAFKDGIFDIDEIWRVMPVLTDGLSNPVGWQ
ncbi:SDR family NAD(P)-dependent oxidoreductase [Chloroflexota bacterium]